MEGFAALLFELSHEDRLNIFLQVKERPSKLTHLSKALDLKVQETSRHLSRLRDAQLISKDVEGQYHITPFGDHVSRLIPAFEFLDMHRDYFSSHLTTQLPDEFVLRIGELIGCSLDDNFMVVLQKAKTLMEEANESLWFLGDHLLPTSPPVLEAAMERGVKLRLLLPEGLVFPPGFEPLRLDPDMIEARMMDRVELMVVLSEKTTLIAFPTSGGDYDNTGFVSSDEASIKWSRDLFTHYWEEAAAGLPRTFPVRTGR